MAGKWGNSSELISTEALWARLCSGDYESFWCIGDGDIQSSGASFLDRVVDISLTSFTCGIFGAHIRLLVVLVRHCTTYTRKIAGIRFSRRVVANPLRSLVVEALIQ